MTLITIFFDVIFYIINGLLNLIPIIFFPSRFLDVFAWFFEFISPGAYLVDMLSFFQCLKIVFVIYTVKFIFAVFNWVIVHIPFLNVGVFKYIK